MTLILECREKIKQFYRQNSVVIIPVLKFLVAFITLNGVNTMMGYMPKLDNIAIVLIASLACSFLPAGCLTLLCALFSLAHMYSLSLEMLIVGLCVYLILFLMLLRFAPKDSYVVVLTPLLFALKIPYIVPIAVGLIGAPLSAISVACGVIAYYFLKMVVGCAPTLRTMEDDLADKLRFLIESLMGNKTVLVIAAAFAITVVVVYLIRKMSVEHAWTIAIVAGAMLNLVLLLVGDLLYDINFSVGSAIGGSVVAVLIAEVIEFFRFFVDYSRTEYVQFEDDDYYYYVKAVPKMNVAAATKTVKRINTPKTRMVTEDEDEEEFEEEPVRNVRRRPPVSGQTQGVSRQVQGVSRVAGQNTSRTSTHAGAGMTSGSGSYGASTRSVTTERTARPVGMSGSQRRPVNYSNQGMTVRSGQASDDSDDYEELF